MLAPKGKSADPKRKSRKATATAGVANRGCGMRGGLRLACLSVLLLLSPAVLSAGSQPPDVPGQADAFSDEDDCGDFAGRDAESVVLSDSPC